MVKLISSISENFFGSVGLFRIFTAKKMTTNISDNQKLAGMRIDYKVSKIHEEELPSTDPMKLFSTWLDEAIKHPGIAEANAMNLATASKDGYPTARIVLLKGFSDEGFRFFTNYKSTKGKQLADNPQVAVTFYWEPLQKQIRINGCVEKLTESASTQYFHSRPFASQIGAMVSRQSSLLPNFQHLEDRRTKLTKKYEGKEVPKPDYWGGYLVKPSLMEFWCGGSGRLHTRVSFRRKTEGEVIDTNLTKECENGWLYELLSP